MNKLVCKETFRYLSSLQDNFIDLGVTSPPYNKQENKNGHLVPKVIYDSISDKLPEDLYQQQQIKVLNELFRVIKPGGSFFYNHKLRWEKGKLLHPMSWLVQTKWAIRQEIIWNRNLAANIRGWRFWQTDERIYWLYKPVDKALIGPELLAKHAKQTSIWKIPPERNNEHPAPFPLAIPLRAIYSVLDNQKGLVIDPYAGSGTTLVAAKLLGHDYIGIEHSAKYVQMATKRLKHYENEREAFNLEVAKHEVSNLAKKPINLLPNILNLGFTKPNNSIKTTSRYIPSTCLKAV